MTHSLLPQVIYYGNMSNDVKPDIASSSSSIPEYDCDVDLPDVGLEIEAKHLLIQLIESVCGLKAITRQSRLLMKWCEKHPELLGVPGSERRKPEESQVVG